MDFHPRVLRPFQVTLTFLCKSLFYLVEFPIERITALPSIVADDCGKLEQIGLTVASFLHCLAMIFDPRYREEKKKEKAEFTKRLKKRQG
jgi:hypothetical protein